MYADDTIAAIATPQGRAGVGIVRVSGEQCSSIATRIFQPSRQKWESHRLYAGSILDAAGTIVDHGLAVMMLRPHSYTGEDVFELHCHGSPIVLRHVLSAVLSHGARLALPGEFTKRAFLNGRLDLAQAEAVIDLVEARTGTAANIAARQVGGQLSQALNDIREGLIRLKALVEVQIDFSEEDVTVDSSQLLSVADDCVASMRRLLSTYRHGKVIREGARVAIVGKPNVGKSSLLNALLGEDRAIVSTLAGTTRDTIEEVADFHGVPVLLTDTAGLRPPVSADLVESIGMDRTTSTIAGADVVLVVVDASRPFDPEDRAVLDATNARTRVLVLNKIDLPMLLTADTLSTHADGEVVTSLSAKTLDGLEQLRQVVVRRLGDTGSVETETVVLTSLRHHDALTKAVQSLELACESIREGRPPDVVAVDVQDSIDHVGEITGITTSEDVLDRIFSEFCIGK